MTSGVRATGGPLARLRLLGFAGAVLLAGGGYLAGALPGAAPASLAQALWGDGTPFRLGLLAYLAGLVLLAVAWWRLGGWFRTAGAPGLRWTLVTGAWWAAPLLLTPPLGSRDVYAYACQGAVWVAGHDPYAVGAAGGGCPWLAAVPPLWHDATAPYGPLGLVVSAGAVLVGRLLAAGDQAQLLVTVAGLRAVALAGMLLVAAYGPRLARACRVDPAAATWLGLVTPLVGLHALAGAHHDALVAGLVVAGLALVTPTPPPQNPRLCGREVAAGVALGLAAAVKVTAVVALPFALLLAAGGARRWRPALAVAGAAGAAYAGLTAVTGLGVGWLAALPETSALVQWSSVPTGLGMAVGYLLRGLGWPEAFEPVVAVARACGLAALAGLAMAMLVRAWRGAGDPARVAAAAGVVLAAMVLLGPVLYPWYALAPLAVLAATVRQPRVRWWLAVATLVLAALVLPTGLGVPVLTKLPGALLVAAAVVALSWQAWRHRGRWWPRRRERWPRRRGPER